MEGSNPISKDEFSHYQRILFKLFIIMKMIFMYFYSFCLCNVYSDVSKGFTSRMLFDRILGSMNILRLHFTPVVIKINL